jgi:hypothetical protein
VPDDLAVIDRDERDDAVTIRAQPVDQVGLVRLAERRRDDRVYSSDVVRLFVADKRG